MGRDIQVEEPSSRKFARLKAPGSGAARLAPELPVFRFHDSALRQLPERYEDIAVAVFDKLAEQASPLLIQNRRIELFVSGDRGGWDESDSRCVHVRIIDINKKPCSDPSEVASLGDADAYEGFGVELEKKIVRLCGIARYLE